MPVVLQYDKNFNIYSWSVYKDMITLIMRKVCHVYFQSISDVVCVSFLWHVQNVFISSP